MLSKTADFVRELPVLYQLRRERHRRRFFSGKGKWGLWGCYASMAEARQEVKEQSRTTYDSDSLVDVNIDRYSRMSLFDYPVVFWMDRLLAEERIRSLVDFGGHTGVKYYAYRDRLDLPSNFAWQVVDVPAMVRRGRQRAESEGARHLTFFTEVGEAAESDLLFCSGSLQYVPDGIDEILKRMIKRPDYVIVNKVSVLPNREIVALENFGTSWVPFRIQSLEKFIALLGELGYEQLDFWQIDDRTYSVPFVKQAHDVKSIGQVWKLIDKSGR